MSSAELFKLCLITCIPGAFAHIIVWTTGIILSHSKATCPNSSLKVGKSISSAIQYHLNLVFFNTYLIRAQLTPSILKSHGTRLERSVSSILLLPFQSCSLTVKKLLKPRALPVLLAKAFLMHLSFLLHPTFF